MLVGNKKDLATQRVVEMTDGAKLALENGTHALSNPNVDCLFLECSALDAGDTVDGIFSKLTQTILYKVESGDITPDLVLNSRSIGSLKP